MGRGIAQKPERINMRVSKDVKDSLNIFSKELDVNLSRVVERMLIFCDYCGFSDGRFIFVDKNDSKFCSSNRSKKLTKLCFNFLMRDICIFSKNDFKNKFLVNGKAAGRCKNK